MPSTTRSYAAGRFELALDGTKVTSYLKSIEGGYSKQTPTDSPFGTSVGHVRGGGLMDIEPCTIDFGIAGAGAMLKWIQASWRDDGREEGKDRRTGMFSHADFDVKQTLSLEFFNALITDTTFPALDAASGEAAYMKVKFQPEAVSVDPNPSNVQLAGQSSGKQKMWTPSSFRMTLDGIEGLDYLTKLESFTISQKVKKYYSSSARLPQLIPTGVTFPNLIGHISAAHAGGLLKWQKNVHKGMSEKKAQTSGSIEFLAPDRKKVLFRLNLFEVGLVNVSMLQSSANAEQVKRMKFELYVGRMDLDGGSMLGFD